MTALNNKKNIEKIADEVYNELKTILSNSKPYQISYVILQKIVYELLKDKLITVKRSDIDYVFEYLYDEMLKRDIELIYNEFNDYFVKNIL